MEKKAKYIFTVKATKDLISISNYTLEHFGILQLETYRDNLANTLDTLAERPQLGRKYTTNSKKTLLRYRYKAHTIFFHPSKDGIVVVRILGNSMNFLKHLHSK